MPIKDRAEYKEYMKEYMRRKRSTVPPTVLILPETISVNPFPDLSAILHHNKVYRRVLRYMVHKAQWLQWRQCFDEVLSEFDERKDAYIAYHNLD